MGSTPTTPTMYKINYKIVTTHEVDVEELYPTKEAMLVAKARIWEKHQPLEHEIKYFEVTEITDEDLQQA